MKLLLSILFILGTSSLSFSQTFEPFAGEIGFKLDSFPIPTARGIYDFAVDSTSNKLYMVGHFNRLNGDSSGCVFSWDGSVLNEVEGFTRWDGLSHIAVLDNELYVAARTDSVRIFRKTGMFWNAIFSAASDEIFQFKELGGSLYLAFGEQLYLFDGNSWETLPADSEVWDLTLFNNELYVTGPKISTVSGNSILAKRVGSDWIDVTVQVDVEFVHNPNWNSYLLAASEQELFFFGNVRFQTGKVDGGIARFDGQLWRDMEASAFPINHMVAIDGILHCTGSLTPLTPNENKKGLMAWDGTRWCEYDSSVFGWNGGKAFVKYGESIICAVDNGSLDSVLFENAVEIKNYSNFSSCSWATAIEEVGEPIEPRAYPNPFRDQVTIEAPSWSTGYVMVELYSSEGSLLYKKGFTGEKVDLDLSSVGSGLYMLRLVTSSKTWTTRLVKSD